MSDGAVWLPIAGFDGLYEISDDGRIRSLTRIVKQRNAFGTDSVHTYRGRVLKPRAGDIGYLYVHLSNCGIRLTVKIHRVVAETFLDPVDGKDQVNHIDGNKKNNHVRNLEWCTPAENHQHSYDIGLSTPCPFGETSHNFKGRIEAIDRGGNIVAVMAGTADITRHGFDFGCVYGVLGGHQKTHKNLTFRRQDQ